MDKRIKKLWVNALRSGKYRRGIGDLKQSDDSKHCRYCCLGVLTDLYCKEKKLSKKDRDYIFHNNDILTEEVIDWAGLDNLDPTISFEDSASACNDIRGFSFKKIADLIEENL